MFLTLSVELTGFPHDEEVGMSRLAWGTGKFFTPHFTDFNKRLKMNVSEHLDSDEIRIENMKL